jgi:hypothetical protein
VLDDRVARLEVQEPRTFTNTKEHLAGERTRFASEPGNQFTGTLVFGFDGRDRQDNVGIQGIGDIVAHNLEAAFRLCLSERETELVETAIG